MEGWIMLHRQVLEHDWLKNHKRWVLWCYLLLKASHKKHPLKVPVRRGNKMTTIEVLLEEGQLIFGRKKAAVDTNMSEQNVRTIIKQLVKSETIHTEPTNDFSIITIVNWSHYQPHIDKSTNTSPPINHHLTTNNNGNNGEKAAAEEASNELNDLAQNLKEAFEELKIPIEKEMLLKSLRKSFMEYGGEQMQDAFATVLARINTGYKISNPIAYGLTILKAEFEKLK
jgi:hypothetical protein